MFAQSKELFYRAHSLIAVASMALLSLPTNALAASNSLDVKNNTTRDLLLKSVSASTNGVEETQNPNLVVGSGTTTNVEFATIMCPKLTRTVWCPVNKNSLQIFQGGDTGTDWNYSLMFSQNTDVGYNMSVNDLALLVPVPENQPIVIQNGMDTTNHFPPTVMFVDLQGGMLYSGPLFSAGQVEILNPITPIPVLGYNGDVISDRDPSVRFAEPFDAHTFAWFERGAVDDNGVRHDDGLPAGQIFTSMNGAVYQIQPANGNNVLQLGPSQTGTLTLTLPQPYTTLYVIGSSGDGTPSSLGLGNINFADGSTQSFNFNVFDWRNGQGNLHPEAALPGPNGIADVGPNGTAFSYVRESDFQLYETVIPIDPWHAGIPILSIDFTGAPDAFYSNIFGVSGQ
jgi:hypothetical protein